LEFQLISIEILEADIPGLKFESLLSRSKLSSFS